MKSKDHHGKVYLRQAESAGDCQVYKMVNGVKTLIRTEKPIQFENVIRYGKQARQYAKST